MHTCVYNVQVDFLSLVMGEIEVHVYYVKCT